MHNTASLLQQLEALAGSRLSLWFGDQHAWPAVRY